MEGTEVIVNSVNKLDSPKQVTFAADDKLEIREKEILESRRDGKRRNLKFYEGSV